MKQVLKCSAKSHVILTGSVRPVKGYIAGMYLQFWQGYFLWDAMHSFSSIWYERGGMHPADDKDVPVFVGKI